jgi:hypothetical protein
MLIILSPSRPLNLAPLFLPSFSHLTFHFDINWPKFFSYANWVPAMVCDELTLSSFLTLTIVEFLMQHDASEGGCASFFREGEYLIWWTP